MPIQRHQFDLGIDTDLEDSMTRIEAFLVEHPTEAYSLAELAGEFEAADLPFEEQLELGRRGMFNAWDTRRQRFNATLAKLAELGVVRFKDVAGVKYFAHGETTLQKILEQGR